MNPAHVLKQKAHERRPRRWRASRLLWPLRRRTQARLPPDVQNLFPHRGLRARSASRIPGPPNHPPPDPRREGFPPTELRVWEGKGGRAPGGLWLLDVLAKGAAALGSSKRVRDRVGRKAAKLRIPPSPKPEP